MEIGVKTSVAFNFSQYHYHIHNVLPTPGLTGFIAFTTTCDAFSGSDPCPGTDCVNVEEPSGNASHSGGDHRDNRRNLLDI